MQRSKDSKLLENLQKDYKNLQEEYSLLNEKYLSAIVKIEHLEKQNTIVSCLAIEFDIEISTKKIRLFIEGE